MATLQKQTKSQVMAYVKEHGTWHGVVCPSKMYPVYGITSYPLDLTWVENRGACVIGETELEYNGIMMDNFPELTRVPRSLDHFLDNWSYYNTSSEEGHYVHYYMLVK